MGSSHLPDRVKDLYRVTRDDSHMLRERVRKTDSNKPRDRANPRDSNKIDELDKVLDGTRSAIESPQETETYRANEP